MPLTDDQETRLQVLKDVAELSDTVEELLILAVWVMDGDLVEEAEEGEFEPEPGEEPDDLGEPVPLEELLEPDPKAPRVLVHSIEDDGLPVMDDLTGQVAFIFDGSIVSGWPVTNAGTDGVLWETNPDVKRALFSGVTHWVEFPVPVRDLAR
jgi:hypothetical protein